MFVEEVVFVTVLGQVLTQFLFLLDQVGRQAIVDIVEEGQHRWHFVFFATVKRLSHCLSHCFSLLLLAFCAFMPDRV